MKKIKDIVLKTLIIFIIPVGLWTTKDEMIAEIGPIQTPWPWEGFMSPWPYLLLVWFLVSVYWMGGCCPRIFEWLDEVDQIQNDS